jgi:hypothetical protein
MDVEDLGEIIIEREGATAPNNPTAHPEQGDRQKSAQGS